MTQPLSFCILYYVVSIENSSLWGINAYVPPTIPSSDSF